MRLNQDCILLFIPHYQNLLKETTMHKLMFKDTVVFIGTYKDCRHSLKVHMESYKLLLNQFLITNWDFCEIRESFTIELC